MKIDKIVQFPHTVRAFLLSFLAVSVYLLFIKLSRIDYYGIFAISAMIIFGSMIFIRIKRIESYLLGILSATGFFILSYFYLYDTFKTLLIVKDWDFFCFYLYGKLAAAGLNFYDPANMQIILSNLEIPFEITQEFYEAVIQVGFPYPPMTMLLFAPLGFLEPGTANILWKVFVLLILFIDIILIIRIIRTDLPNKLHIAGLATLTLIFPGTFSVISFWQTNFLLLLFLLLALKSQDNWKSGIFLALAVMIKPLAAVWILYLIIRKKWPAMISLVITGLAVVIISVIFFGIDSFLTYFTSPPTLRMPQWTYTESINQSLFAVLSRSSTKLGLMSLADNLSIIVTVLSIILILLTCLASYKFSESNRRLSFLIFIPLSLIIYPGTLDHYSVLLLPMFFEILSKQDHSDLQLLSFIILFLFVSGLIISFTASFSILILLIIYSFIKTQSPLLSLFKIHFAVPSAETDL